MILNGRCEIVWPLTSALSFFKVHLRRQTFLHEDRFIFDKCGRRDLNERVIAAHTHLRQVCVLLLTSPYGSCTCCLYFPASLSVSLCELFVCTHTHVCQSTQRVTCGISSAVNHVGDSERRHVMLSCLAPLSFSLTYVFRRLTNSNWHSVPEGGQRAVNIATYRPVHTHVYLGCFVPVLTSIHGFFLPWKRTLRFHVYFLKPASGQMNNAWLISSQRVSSCVNSPPNMLGQLKCFSYTN